MREGRCMQRAGAWTAVWPPISLALSAAVARNLNMEPKLSDCIVEDIDFIKLSKLIKEFAPSLIVINTATPSIVSDLSVAALAKKINPKIKVAAFGIHVSALPEDSFRIEPALDIIVRGEPESTIAELTLGLQEGKNLSGIAGLSFRQGPRIIHNPERSAIENLDSLPFPAWDLIDRSKYILPFTTDKEFLLVATSRGCPFGCLFCADRAYYGNKLRLFSPVKIVDGMVQAKRNFGIDTFLFWAESFTINQKFAEAVSDEIIKRNEKFTWICNSRVDHVNLSLLKKFKSAGCIMVGYGIESGNQGVLDSAGKGITIEQIKEAARMTKKAGLQTVGHCIIGLPGETRNTIAQTVKFVKKLDLDFAQFYCAVPFPGSALYEAAKERGWINTGNWTYFEQNYSVMDLDKLTARETMKLRHWAYLSFYLRPKMVYRTLMRIKSWKQFLNFCGMVWEFFDWAKT